jgi:cohesin complex subunit SA-1/2
MVQELAKRFALSFGLDAVKNREAITALHREGILFSVNPLENSEDPTGPPPNLPFLEILTEFTNKLLKQDKRVVYVYFKIILPCRGADNYCTIKLPAFMEIKGSFL